jgi:hypothetical protein
MATSIKKKKEAQEPPTARSRRFKQIGKGSSQIVKDAAALLDEEIASGIVAAKQMQQRFQKEQRVDPGDFKDALKRFQGDAHEIVNMMNDQVGELGSKETSELGLRLSRNAHDLLDLVVELVNTSAEVADRLVQSSALSKNKTK